MLLIASRPHRRTIFCWQLQNAALKGCFQLNSINNADLSGDNLVFLVACPRSGTTWLQRLLATHPQIKTGRESRLFEYIGGQFRLWHQDLDSHVGLAAHLNEEEFLAVQKQYLASLLAPMLRELQPGEIFLEKTPMHALFIPEIVKLLPRAKILHLARDPRDVTASLLAASKTWARDWAPRRAKKAVRMWWQHVSAVRKAAALLPPGQFLEIRYEGLHRDPVSVLRGVAGFLELPWAEADIAPAVSANTVDQMRQGKGTPIPVHGEHRKHRFGGMVFKDFFRKAQPGSWRTDLTLLERWEMRRALRKIGPEWKQYARG